MNGNVATRDPYSIDDPTVAQLARFLERVPVSNGQVFQGLSTPITSMLAQAIANWTRGLVFQEGEWIDRVQWEATPDLGDVEIEELGGGAAYKMTQRSTGVYALGETHGEAWAELRRKVAGDA